MKDSKFKNQISKAILLPLLLLTAACEHYDDFDFTGTVVDFEMCQSSYEVGYAVVISSPDTLGGSYLTQDGKRFDHVVVVYGADQFLHPDDKISGRIYLDPNYSKAECMYHYDRDVPEAVFTKLRVE